MVATYKLLWASKPARAKSDENQRTRKFISLFETNKRKSFNNPEMVTLTSFGRAKVTLFLLWPTTQESKREAKRLAALLESLAIRELFVELAVVSQRERGTRDCERALVG